MRALFLVFLAASFVFADGLVNALRSGEKEGDVHILGDLTSSSAKISGTKYQNGAFLAASFGLYYKSAFYKNFRAHLGFRGSLPLLEKNGASIQPSAVRGDAGRDFWYRALMARSFLEYFDGDTSVRAGRLEEGDDLLAKHFDGIWVQNKSLGYLLIDAIWVYRVGTVLYREISGFDAASKFKNNYGGMYRLGATLEAREFVKVKAYGGVAPNHYSLLGLKASLDYEPISANLGFVSGFEGANSEYRGKMGFAFHADVAYRHEALTAQLGFVGTSAEIGMGSLPFSGDNLNPFFYFSGDALDFHRNDSLIFGKVGFDNGKLAAFLVYGYNLFNAQNPLLTRRYAQGEVNLHADYKLNDFSSVIVYFLNTHGGAEAVPTLTQFGVAARLGF